jgi:endonuclease/exonuclease/phosphatase family metal-dependent hydrolase
VRRDVPRGAPSRTIVSDERGILMRRTGRLRALVATLALSIGLLVAPDLVGLTRPAAAGTPTPRPGDLVEVLTWNMCGTADHCPYRNSPHPLVDALVRSIRDHESQVVILQEVCTTHTTYLRSQLGDGWRVYHAPVSKGGQPVACANAGGTYGVALAVRGEPDLVWTVPLPSPPGTVEQRVAVCVRFDSRGLQTCSAHFSAKNDDGGRDGDGSYRREQAAALAALANDGAARGYRVIVGGDLNAIPPDEGGTPYANPPANPALAALYQSVTECSEGRYQARRGEPTYGTQKIDYLFGTKGGFSAVTCDVTRSEFSDHAPLFGMFTVGDKTTPPFTPTVRPRAHSHNDEWDGRAGGPKPVSHWLIDALDQGFGSIEVDVWLSGGALKVGHDAPTAETLAARYLQPLQNRVTANAGSVYRGYTRPVNLVVEIKNYSPAALNRLSTELAPYAGMLYRLQNGQLVPGPVRIILTGGVDAFALSLQKTRSVFADGPKEFPDDGQPYENTTMPILNLQWSKVTSWRGDGVPPRQVSEALAREARRAHTEGRELRLWDTPQTYWSYQALLMSDVDYIETDEPAALGALLHRDGGAAVMLTPQARTTVSAGYDATGQPVVSGRLTDTNTNTHCPAVTVTWIRASGSRGATTTARACDGASTAWSLRAPGVPQPYWYAEVSLDAGARVQYVSLSNATHDVYLHVLHATDRWVEVPGGSKTQGTQLAINTLAPQPYLQWKLQLIAPFVFRIVNVNSGMCIGVAGNSTANAAAIVQWPCVDARNQQWYFPGEGTPSSGWIRNLNSGKCIGVAGGGTAVGTKLIQWPCTDTLNQTYAIDPI